jgi:hypothetical protein
MRNWKRIASCLAVFATVAAAAVAGQAPREGGGAGQRMSREERAKLAKAAAPLAAKAIAQYVELSAEETKKFTKAYVEETVAAQKRFAEVMGSGDREKMMAVFRESGKKMQELLETHMKPEQAKKARTIVGRFNSLDRSIQGLLRAKVEQAKVEKALAVLVKHAVGQQELFGKMREADDEARRELFGKMRELREKAVKDLTPIVGEEGAAAWQRYSGMRGMGGRRGGGEGQRGGGGQGGSRQ